MALPLFLSLSQLNGVSVVDVFLYYVATDRVSVLNYHPSRGVDINEFE